MGLRRLLTAMGLGAGLMYFYDPDQGDRRRSLLRDQFTKLKNDNQDFLAKAKTDLQNRRQGMKAEPITGGLGGLSGDWTPGVRLVAALAGGGMTFYGLAKSGVSGVAATLLGINLVSHSVFSGSMGGASEDVQAQSEQATSTAGAKGGSNGQKHRRSDAGSTAGSTAQQRQASGVNASLTSEQGASSNQYPGSESSAGKAESGSARRDFGDESLGFDSMLPGNLPEGDEH